MILTYIELSRGIIGPQPFADVRPAKPQIAAAAQDRQGIATVSPGTALLVHPTDRYLQSLRQLLRSENIPAAPQGPSPTAPAATGAAAGTASPDETPENNPGPISQNQESNVPENTGAALLQKHGAMNVRQALNNPVTQDILQSVAPNTAAFLLKRAGIADKTSFRNRGRANG
jgi:hypothetical protein